MRVSGLMILKKVMEQKSFPMEVFTRDSISMGSLMEREVTSGEMEKDMMDSGRMV